MTTDRSGSALFRRGAVAVAATGVLLALPVRGAEFAHGTWHANRARLRTRVEADLAQRAARAEALARDAMAVVQRARAAAATDDGRRVANRPEGPNSAQDIGADRLALIGLEVTPLVTTLGSRASKVLATDPAWAGALVAQLASHGVGRGSSVAASFSGSFPGLNIAVMASCAALEARLVAVSSVTASTWGANEPGWTWPELEARIVAAGALPAASAAISLGGSRDTAADLTEEGRVEARRIQVAAASSLRAEPLATTTLNEAVEARLVVYSRTVGSKPAVYVNVGGSHASLGGANAPFRHNEGWLTTLPPHASARTSVVHAMLARGVPVLNLLDVKALAAAWGVADTEK